MSKRRRPPSQRPERRPDIRSSLVRATSLMVRTKLALGQPAEKIARDIRKAIGVALEGESVWCKAFDVGGGPEPFLSTSGVYRLIFAEHDVDRSDLMAQERWFAVVEGALTDALSSASPGVGGGRD